MLRIILLLALWVYSASAWSATYWYSRSINIPFATSMQAAQDWITNASAYTTYEYESVISEYSGGIRYAFCARQPNGSWGHCIVVTATQANVATCPAPLVEQNGACVEPAPVVDEQQELCNALKGTETYGTVKGSASPGSSSCNAVGCTAVFAGTVIRVKDAQGQYVTEGAMTFTDQVCTFSPDTGSTEDTCPGGTEGQVNGVSVCVSYDPNLNTIESVKSTTSTTANASGTSTVTTSQTTTCSNGSCNTTSTTVVNVNGTPTTETKTTQEPQTDYCAKNPNDAQCKDDGAFSGSCGGGFTCSGDAVQCAMAREQHARACQLFDGQSDERAAYEAAKNAGPVTVPGPTMAITPASFDTSNPLGAGSCISDVEVVVWGSSISLPFSTVCGSLEYLRAVLLAVSFLIAIRIVARG